MLVEKRFCLDNIFMKQSKVSVIVPVYNMEKYLAASLESVLKSDYAEFEVIVIDDGSTDQSLAIANQLAEKDGRIRVYSQPNSGVSAARNLGIEMADGTYILPVDADDLIAYNYISAAVKVLDANPNVKVVSREAHFFGNKSGRWVFKPFSLDLLCRRNIIDVCSMYRKSDWKLVGGYCREIPGREDWDFWLSIFEHGGDFVRLPLVGLYYRIRKQSKRITDRKNDKEVIDILNKRHKPLFFQVLGGKLHYQRTYSKLINKIISIFFPHNVFVKTENIYLQKLVYGVNIEGDAKKLLRMNKEEVRYITFKEKRIHVPGSKIKKSLAREYFNPLDPSHIGYYEKQVSTRKMISYLVLTTTDLEGSIRIA